MIKIILYLVYETYITHNIYSFASKKTQQTTCFGWQAKITKKKKQQQNEAEEEVVILSKITTRKLKLVKVFSFVCYQDLPGSYFRWILILFYKKKID